MVEVALHRQMLFPLYWNSPYPVELVVPVMPVVQLVMIVAVAVAAVAVPNVAHWTTFCTVCNFGAGSRTVHCIPDCPLVHFSASVSPAAHESSSTCSYRAYRTDSVSPSVSPVPKIARD